MEHYDYSETSSSSEDDTEVDRVRREVKKVKKDGALKQLCFKMRARGDSEKSKFLVEELMAARAQLAVWEKKESSLKIKKKNDLGIVTPGNYQQLTQPDEKTPQDIFPMEVWCNIFDKLKKPQDVINCSKASLDWEEGLKPKRTQYLFEQVLPILINNNTFPANPQELFQRLLELRQVCHLWRGGVDTYLDNHPCHFHLDQVCASIHKHFNPTKLANLNWMECHKAVYVCSFPNPDYIEQGGLEQHPLSPRCAGRASFFPGRAISLNNHSDRIENRTLFWNAALDLLSKVGEQIWHLEFQRLGSDNEDQLWSVLKLVPNLRTLCVEYKSRSETYPPSTSTEPLPPLPKLEVLKIPCCRPFPPFIHRLLRSYTHIKKLGLMNFPQAMTFYGGREEENAPNHLLDIISRPNLEAFCIQSFYDMEEREIALVRSFIMSYPTLQYVSLQVPYCGESNSAFRCLLNELGRREGVPLKTLCLEWPNHFRERYPRFQGMLRFPGLENLTLYAIDTHLKLYTLD